MEIYNKNSVLITGGTSGIGYQATLKLIKNGCRVIVLCRNQSRAEDLKKLLENDEISSFKINDLLTLPIVDLSDLNSIDSFAENFLNQDYDVDTFVFNAGLQYTGSKIARRSTQNIELTFAVNHLSHHLLMQRLLPKLLKSKSPRVVITSSEVHNPESPGGKVGGKADLGELKGLESSFDFLMIDGSNVFDADKAYKDSKLCNILFAKELSKRLRKNKINIPIISWAPGLVIPRSSGGFFRYSRKYNEIGQIAFAFLARDILRITSTPESAGQDLLDLVLSDRYISEEFIFMSNSIKSPGEIILEKGNISEEAKDQSKAKKLWDLSNITIENFLDNSLF